ncbi:site-specific recombinase, phage integrase family [Mycobacterium parascrofulaceum ATCC BAA-614]|uniref:Site-specific recombinase, phage integrase family n=1 Tax=Mycobacterium parascrofulaceum ATCC BAA-614 TaxID=525368 RepID=D5PF43_9MYCO|nr:tyrosine-type recombinase/integrase [Mycobacterium parascrofulaceum]EFG75323.1 site-specific recombinase, phage integrase family [Mycobacterium parascrofulaceum ATCC BAA-614]
MGQGKANLPQLWEAAISGWMIWLRIAGKREGTIELRRDHLRSIARRSRTSGPAEITLSTLVLLCSERKWSNDHRKSVRTSLISFYDWAIDADLVSMNPAAKLPRVKPDLPAPRPAPDDVWEELLAAAQPRERLMARLAGEAGLRRAEVALVHSDDLIRDLHGWSLIVHGKGGKQRVAPLNDGLTAELRAFCTSHGYLFPGQVDGHISAEWVGTVISRLMPPGWSMHKLRHRFATLGYSGTGNLRAVQEALGHASVATTQRYTAVSTREVRSVADAACARPAVPSRAAAPAPTPAVSVPLPPAVPDGSRPAGQVERLSWPPKPITA